LTPSRNDKHSTFLADMLADCMDKQQAAADGRGAEIRRAAEDADGRGAPE